MVNDIDADTLMTCYNENKRRIKAYRQAKWGPGPIQIGAEVQRFRAQYLPPRLPQMPNVSLTIRAGRRMEKARSLRELHLAAKLTQAKLAMRCSVPRQRIGRWERTLCQPSLCHAVLLARALGVPLDDIARAVDQSYLARPLTP